MLHLASRMRSTLLVVSLVCSANALAGSALGAPLKVACVGDSITQVSGWPERLRAKLGADYTVSNYGVTGSTILTHGDHPYVTTLRYRDSLHANPDVVVIMLGTNDSKPANWNRHNGEFIRDYMTLVDSYAALPSHPRIYLVLCPPAGKNDGQISGATIEREVNPRIGKVAVAKRLQVIDIFSAFGGHNFDSKLFGPGDEVHPNTTGAERIADAVYAAHLRQRARTRPTR